MSNYRKSAIVFVIVFLAIPFNRLSAQNYNLYSYFVYTVAKYTEWPAEYKTGDFIIGVLGESPAEESFKQLAMKKTIGGNPVKLAKFEKVGDITKCHILFLPIDRSEEIKSVLAKIQNTSTLLITEKEGMALRGSCVNFVTREGKLAFEINRAAYEKQNLKASQELTKYALVL